MLNHFTYNGKSTGDLGLLVSGINIYGAPSRVVEKVNIPYRSGDLIIDTGAYTNYLLTYTIDIMDNVKVNAEEINEWLLNSRGYNRLEDTYNPEYYRVAAYYNDINYTLSALYRYGKATISFDCKPQKYLLSGETTQTFNASGTLTNPSGMASKPLIRVYSAGDLEVNGYSITVDSVDGYVDIDSETMQIFKGTVNKGSTVTLDGFPQLDSGSNTITLTSVSKVDITPRWWKL